MFRLCSSLILILFLLCHIPTTVLAQNSSAEMFLVAQKAFEDGFYDVAIRYIEQLKKDFPQNEKAVEANLLLGQCYFFKGQYLKAYDVFEELLKQEKYKDIILFWLGETYLKGADYRQAQEHYQKLLELFPDSEYVPQTLYSIGWVYYEQNEYPKAQDVFAQLVQKFPDHQLAEDAGFKAGECDYHLKNYDAAIEYFEKYLLKYPKSNREGEVYFYLAEAYYYKGDPLNAATYYAKTADVSFDQKLVLMAKVSLGWSYLKLERYQLAQKYFDEAIVYAEGKGILTDDVYLGQANLYTATEEYEKALEAYNNLIENFPNSKRISESLLGKANVQYKLQKYSEAITAYKEVLAKTQENPLTQDIYEKAYFGLAWSYLKSDDIDQAVESFEAIQNKTPNETVKISALTQIGDAYQDAEKYEKAISVYDQILLEYSDSLYTDYVQYRQGIALLKMKKLDAAKMSFQSLKSNFPKSKYVNDTNYYLAVSYYQNGNWRLAQESIQEFIAYVDDQHEFLKEAYTILGLSSFYAEDFDTALATFQRMKKNFPLDQKIVRSSELNIAKCLYEKGEITEALSRFKQMKEKYGNDSSVEEALIWLGDHYLKIGDFYSAIVYYKEFLELFPKSEQLSSVLYELGQSYEGLGQYEHAVTTFKEIPETPHKEIYVKAKLAIADIFSRKLNPESAIQTYQNIIESSPEFKRDAFVKIAEVHKANQKYDETIQAYKTAIGSEMNSSLYTDPQLYFDLADAYELSKDADAAVEAYLKIGYLFPDESSWIVKAYLRIARIFENQENWEQARLAYEKITDYDTDESKFAQERIQWIKTNIK